MPKFGSLDLLLINPACVDYNPKNIFSLFLHKLVNYCPPGLLYLAANVKNNGFKVSIYDMELKYKLNTLMEYIEKTKPRIIGITALTFNYLNALNVAMRIKRRFPEILVVFGGLHVSKNPHEAIKYSFIDYVLIGEADNSLVQLMKLIVKNEGLIENIPGLIYKVNGKIIINEGFPIVEDLDSLPYPAIDLIERNRYFVSFQKKHPSSIIMGSRGCPFKCVFCDKLTNKVRLRSIDNIISEIKYFYTKYNIRDFQFYDLSFNVNKEWVKELCKKIIHESIFINWRCTARVELIDEELIKLLKESGCYLIAFGVESGNDESLKFLRKGFTVRDIVNAFRLTKKFDIETHAYYIVGIPGEDKKKVLNTIRIIKSIKPDYINSLTLRPLPNTELAELSKQKGWFDFSNYNILNPDFKYQNNITMVFKEMSPKQILKMRKLSMRAYFLNLRFIIQFLKKFLKEPNRFLFNIWMSIKELFKII